MSTALRIRGLVAGYGGAPVLRGVDLEVGYGEVVALLGANGAGKTTLLHTLVGEHPITSGEIEIASRASANRSPSQLARKGTLLVPDDRGLLMGLTARENLLLVKRRGTDPVRAAVDQFPELAGRLDTRAGLLSGGEQQMLALGRALAQRPRLLLVDELSHGLAPILVQRILPVLRGIANIGAAVLVVEQHVPLALELADRAYVLSSGQLTSSGTRDEMAARAHLLRHVYLATASAPGDATNPKESPAW